MRDRAMAAHLSHKQEVLSSNLGLTTKYWDSSVAEHYSDTVRVDGSNPSPNTKQESMPQG